MGQGLQQTALECFGTVADCVDMLQVVYWDQKALLLSYLKPDLPEGLYR